MNGRSIAAVAWREVEEVLADWRMAIPLLILTFIVPSAILALLLMASRMAPEMAMRVLPLALVLCGFLPAGFSLVNASESFAGEKERSTLESLLSTPITDGEIYFGKFLAALLPPVCSSLVAIGTFGGGFVAAAPHAVVQALGWSMAGGAVGLTVCNILVMVAAAILISIQSTTVRAASLLASFILVPMGIIVQMEVLLLAAGHATALAGLGVTLLAIPALVIRAGFAAFDREKILARDYASLNIRRGMLTLGGVARSIVSILSSLLQILMLAALGSGM